MKTSPQLLSFGLPLTLAVLALGFMPSASSAPQDPTGKLRKALKDNASDFWIYDNLKAGYAKAKKTKKPLLVSFRCVP